MSSSPGKRFISASEFKARCLELMDDVRATRAELIITKHGAAVARLVPVAETATSALGFLRGTVRNDPSLFDSEVMLGAIASTGRVTAEASARAPLNDARSDAPSSLASGLAKLHPSKSKASKAKVRGSPGSVRST